MRQLKYAVLIFASFSLLCGLLYPLFITAVSQVFFPHRANGSIVTIDRRDIGSELIGQTYENPAYFHGRPSATEPAYDAGGSAGSNLGPSSAKLLEQVKERIGQVRKENGLMSSVQVPADLVLSSASGLDPHISPESALLQVPRIARARRLPEPDIASLLSRHTEKPLLGVWGRERVNVLKMNMALDNLKKEQ